MERHSHFGHQAQKCLNPNYEILIIFRFSVKSPTPVSYYLVNDYRYDNFIIDNDYG